ncbi:filamentous hemagglutinin N-terminal domain-containing protein [Candidatus Nitronereus thalassa]|uniref:Filamentous hemagglutinin N-terminal domain-containing protein n=1 Tax=Candidatus Nitronereus thalassa TaxID=3020898 RepID=A0ABU3K9Q1_9BACT|nr:filamentous hemagglutinin N-terminal domain-containing protein [Candidatus Nitronereus thalassa]MDT7043028.1 filamentous hemagglutinin N-terminal domain-containing protein [Candidatus Nitronereus thalassa]
MCVSRLISARMKPSAFPNSAMGRKLILFLTGLIFLSPLMELKGEAVAQTPHITIDGTLQPLGGSGPQGFTDPDVTITEGMGVVLGSSLIHSFGVFNIPTGGSATFTGATPGIANVLSRVTGGQVSIIDGTLNSTIPGANFFLINPFRIEFGPNATLNIGTLGQPGSFTATTANVIHYEDSTVLYADPAMDANSNSILRMNPVNEFGFVEDFADIGDPQGFEFTTDTPMPIRVNGSFFLNVPTGEDLTLIGGDIDVNSGSFLFAGGGKVKLASLSTQGTVTTSPGGSTLDIDSPGQNNGQVSLTGGSFVDVSDLFFEANGQSGTVLIRGGQFVMDTGSVVFAQNFDVQDPVDPSVDIKLTGTMTMDNGSTIFSDTLTEGNSGNIIVEAYNLEVQGGSTIQTNSGSNPSPDGNAGNVTVNVDHDVRVSGANSVIQSASTSATGNSGIVSVTAGQDIIVENQGSINTVSQSGGLANNVSLDAKNLVVQSGGSVLTSNTGSGSTGLVSIETDNTTTISGNNSRISNRNLGPAATGSNQGITIQAADFVLDTGARVDTESVNVTGGAISITGTNSLMVKGQSLGEPSRIVSDAANSDVAPITLNAPTILFDQGSVRTRTAGTGNGGAISVNGTNVTFSNGATSLATTTGQGNAGSTTINATNSVTIASGSRFDSSSANNATGEGGPITVVSENDVTITGANTGLFSETETIAKGGNISVTGNQVVFSNGATASAQSSSMAANAGDSGSVTITTTGGNFQSNNATLSTSAVGAQGGDILIDAAQNAEFTNNSLVTALNTNTNAQAIAADPLVGTAGGITVVAGDTIFVDNSTFNVQSLLGNAGNIKFDANILIHVRNSLISGSTGGGPTTQGANIDFDPLWIIIENSRIVANAFEGTGGNITFTATQGVFIDQFTTENIDFSSQFGTSGSLDVQAPIINLSGIITPLPQDALKVAKMFAARCAAQQGGQFSSFVQGGRDGIPPPPGGFMTSPLNMSLPQSFSNSPSFIPEPSGNMVKRLGMEAADELARHSHWMIGDTIRGCAA